MKINPIEPDSQYAFQRTLVKSWKITEFVKGQLISKCPFGVFKSAKIFTKFFPGFLPLKRGKIKKVGYESQNKILQLMV